MSPHMTIWSSEAPKLQGFCNRNRNFKNRLRKFNSDKNLRIPAISSCEQGHSTKKWSGKFQTRCHFEFFSTQYFHVNKIIFFFILYSSFIHSTYPCLIEDTITIQYYNRNRINNHSEFEAKTWPKNGWLPLFKTKIWPYCGM